MPARRTPPGWTNSAARGDNDTGSSGWDDGGRWGAAGGRRLADRCPEPGAEDLRIIAGQLKGRRLDAPSWEGLRPTSDKLRETLFNILGPRVAGARVLDACAGTGAVGIEAISRGAAHVTFIDRDARAVALIGTNLARCAVTDGYTLIRAALGAAARIPQAEFDLI